MNFRGGVVISGAEFARPIPAAPIRGPETRLQRRAHPRPPAARRRRPCCSSRIGRCRRPVTYSAASSVGGVASLVGLSLAATVPPSLCRTHLDLLPPDQDYLLPIEPGPPAAGAAACGTSKLKLCIMYKLRSARSHMKSSSESTANC
jgi:hypothetical protein